MLKAELEQENAKLQKAVDKLETDLERSEQREDTAKGRLEEAETQAKTLRKELAAAQKLIDQEKLPAAPSTPAETREYLENLLITLGELDPVARSYVQPARIQIARALGGRWEDEDDPDPVRCDRIAEMMREE